MEIDIKLLQFLEVLHLDDWNLEAVRKCQESRSQDMLTGENPEAKRAIYVHRYIGAIFAHVSE